jgi:plasmid stability protein
VQRTARRYDDSGMEPSSKSKKTTVTLSIKNVPNRLVKRLRRKAAIHKRSLQGELMAVLKEATSPAHLTVDELRQAVRRFRPIPGDSTKMIREDRDAR